MQFYTILGIGGGELLAEFFFLNVQLNIDLLPLELNRTTYLGHQ